MSTFGEDKPGVVRVFDSEELMLLEFLFDIQDKDPDMLISWFGSKLRFYQNLLLDLNIII